jgi:glycosyltransferase involved in cell wall biosynthesis
MEESAIRMSIITVCKNSAQFLDETITSVLNQDYPNIEYIIIDGNSNDNTLDIIKQYSQKIALWISEKDEGMYDAINKGLKLATGDYILILNSDDVLAEKDVIKNVAKEISNTRLNYYYGNIIKQKEGKFKKVKLFPVSYKKLLYSTHGTFVPHPCFFISSKMNSILEGYNPEFKYASDYDYILRVLKDSASQGLHMSIFTTIFRIHENSITASGKINDERKKILKKHGYYSLPGINRLFFYYTLWIYYKIINLFYSYRHTNF